MAWNSPRPIQMSLPKRPRAPPREQRVNEGVNRASGCSPVEHPALPPENLAESFFHKLSQPIGAIYASLEVGLMSDDARQLKAAIEAGLTQLEVLRWLFQIARQFLATDFCVRARSISLRECIAIAVNDWRPLADAKEITFLISAPQDSHVLADPIYLRDAVGNLLSRSVRSSHRTSVI